MLAAWSARASQRYLLVPLDLVEALGGGERFARGCRAGRHLAMATIDVSGTGAGARMRVGGSGSVIPRDGCSCVCRVCFIESLPGPTGTRRDSHSGRISNREASQGAPMVAQAHCAARPWGGSSTILNANFLRRSHSPRGDGRVRPAPLTRRSSIKADRQASRGGDDARRRADGNAGAAAPGRP